MLNNFKDDYLINYITHCIWHNSHEPAVCNVFFHDLICWGWTVLNICIWNAFFWSWWFYSNLNITGQHSKNMPSHHQRKFHWHKMILWLSYLNNGIFLTLLTHHLYRDRFVYVLSQWETTLHCNIVSHWLGAYTKWSLLYIESSSRATLV